MYIFIVIYQTTLLRKELKVLVLLDWDSMRAGLRPEGGFHISFLNALPKEEESFKSKLLFYSCYLTPIER